MSQANNFLSVGAVILAAGRGTRLGCTDIPKVMLDVDGHPLVSYIVETLEAMGLSKKQIMLVVGFHAEKVKEYFDGRVSYTRQNKQRGTADAAFTGMYIFSKAIETVLVLGGDDSAFYSPEALLSFIKEHTEKGAKLSLLTAEVKHPDFLGRVVRHPDGNVEIIEKEYVTEEQKKICEISTGTFCFDRVWFEDIFPNMPQLRKLGEYGLPTALAIAHEQNVLYNIMKLQNSNEWFGVNTPDELKEARQRKAKQNI